MAINSTQEPESRTLAHFHVTGDISCENCNPKTLQHSIAERRLTDTLVTEMSTTTALRPEESVWDNNDRSLKRGHEEVVTPTTPRPPSSQTFQSLSAEVGTDPVADPSGPSTLPTDHTSLSPTTFSFPAQHDPQPSMLYRGSSQTSLQSSVVVDDMEIDGSDDDQDGSDNDTENGESGRSSKKKKGQRFFCTDFPPCNLSFTRSEHLARHIRKHTGERPFQCHCNRRFSRLDNLRQHAQTVHVNEEIPGDSLAATGTRFQRQIRTDRVRSAGGRPRSGTVGSSGSLSRGHGRNLSTSSVGSSASTYSNTTETHRRPPPLIMANDGNVRPKPGIERPTTPPAQYRGYQTNSPGGFSATSSATYPATPGSPGFGSTMESPISTSSRGMGFFGSRTPNRRLSVPSGPSPFQNSHNNNYPPPSYPTPLAPSALNYANQGSVYASPTSSTFSAIRTEPSAIPGDDWRRRTWHPSTYTTAGFNYSRPATSGLTYSQTPDAPQPAFAQYATAAAGQAPRLPGIESFDHVQYQPSTPPRRHPSPTRIDPALQAPVFATPNVPYRSHSGTSGHKRGRHSVDISLNNNLTKLDIHGNQQRETTTWGQQTMSEIQDAAARQVVPENHGSSNQVAAPMQIPHQTSQPGLEMGQPSTPPKIKRQGWYNGPLTAMRTSPEDSSSSEGVPTPGTSAAEIHPAIMHSNGYIEPHHAVLVAEPCTPQSSNLPNYPTPQTATQRSTYYSEPRSGTNDMGRLEALVAVATSEDNAASISR